MSQFFAGLASSGSWSCFDEFNRINIEVLSVIAQQVRTIQEAIAAHAETFVLDQRTLKLNSNAAIIITMNPGYAGRTELPAKLLEVSKINIATVKNETSGLGSALPGTFLIMVALYILAWFILNYTMVGRSVYALGGDEISAERAGINVKKVRFGVFVVNGGIAAVAGLCYAMMSYFYMPNEYAGSEMLVIAAVILGGTRMTGGVGTLRGCLLGTFLLI